MRLLAACLLGVCVASASEPMPAARQNELVHKYCAVCHTDAAPQGGLSLEHFDAAHIDPSLAAMLVGKLRNKAMGASGIPRPDDATVAALTAVLDSEAAGAAEWTVNQNKGVATASIVRSVPTLRNQEGPSLYRLTVACSGEMKLTWGPAAINGSLRISADGKPAVMQSVEGASAVLDSGRSLPSLSLLISGLFPGESVNFPFDALPDRVRQCGRASN